VGAGDAGVPAAGGIVLDAEPEQKPSRDFRITDSHRIGQGSLSQKARDNIAAIRALKKLEGEERDATADEKATLARYAGWGALSGAFDATPPAEFTQAAKDLQELLTEGEYESARASTPNAHFTSPMVIAGIWEGMRRLGLRDSAQILEPSMGVGHFLGLMPDDLLPGSHRTGVELDSVTARIAQKLYPDSTIFAKGFEETPLPDNYFDAAVGNVPFGNYPVHDPSYPKNLTRAVHDYFFAKSLDKVRPGGVMALVTSRYTMDKQDGKVRDYLADGADLIGAIRLPNTAFKANAGTEVTTDILFLRKRGPGEKAQGHAWRTLLPVETADGPMEVNEYFARHPSMMLGKLAFEGTMDRGGEPTLAGNLTPELLTRAIMELPEGAYIPRDRERPPPLKVIAAEAVGGVKEGAFAERDGQLFIRSGAKLEPANISASSAQRVRGMMLIRDAVRRVFATQLDDAPEQEITEARRFLGRAYDSFVRSHGPLSSKENLRAFAGDPDQPLLLSLENYDAGSKRAAKAAIFERRTLERYKPAQHVETSAEALAISLNETGDIHWPRMTSLTGRSEKQLQRELADLIYRNPNGGDWETADRYLSGNVRDKLTAAQAAAAIDPAYRRNVEALTAVQPPDLLPGDISARLGSSWIPASDVRDFIAELLNTPPGTVTVNHSGAIATWTVTLDGFVRASASNIATHGTPRVRAAELIEDALNGRTPTVYDQLDKDTRVINQQETLAAREKQQQLKDRFSEWIWQDGERAHRLARHYNDTFNNLRLRTYDGSHLTFPGMNKQILRSGDLDKHQRDAVWRTLQSDSTLLAHCVGAGKTWEITASAMEMRRLGLATKPMIVVPNHLVEQWGAAFLQLYPQANIFVAGKEHFSKGNREQAMSRIATGNFDAVIVSHRSFELLPVSDELFERFVDRQVSLLEDAILEAKADKGDSRRIVKELEKAKKRLIAKIKDRAGRENKDRTLTFEELGVDQIFVDESDLYKNLGFVSKMNRIAGLPNTESNRAQDMFVKTGYLRERNEGRGVVFATGTPISNTMAEMYTLTRYLAPELLGAAGVEHFDAWAANFGEAVTSLELAPDGSGYRMHTRFAKFVNLPELLSMFRSFADVQTADMLKLPRPGIAGGKPHVVAAPASPELKAYVQTLVDRAQRLKSGGVDPRDDNMLKITGDGRKAALDMRLVAPGVHVDGETKLSRAIEKIHRTWEQTRDKRSTQLVFCDLSTPHPDRFNVYDELRDRLIKSGIPEAEIAYIHDADSDAQKKTLFDSVNAGRIRILLGSTEKMGAGTNVQRKLIAEHHLDAPWRPRDIEQREGRILRQGNENAEVDIYRYVTEGSFDAYMWQTLETKARFIQQVMNGSVTVRHAEDLDGGALTFAEIKAIASGNPAVMEKVKVDTEIRKLDQLRSSHLNQQHNIRWQVKNIPDHIRHAKDTAERINKDIATREANSPEEFTMTVGNRTFSGKGAREEAAKALNDVALSWRNDETQQVRGRFRGFDIVSRGHAFGSDYEPEIFVRGALTYRAQLNPENPLGTLQSIEHAIRSLDRREEQEREELERHEKALAEYQAQLNRPFEHERRLKELLAKQAELNAALDLDKNERQVAQDEPQTEKDAGPSTFVGRLKAEERGTEAAL
jgi:N12 class adenine-specific DNA methylase